MKSLPTHRLAWVLLLAGLIALLLLFLFPQGHAKQLTAFLLLWIIPGLLWTLAFAHHWRQALSSPASILGGAGLATLIPLLLTLVASYLPGPLSTLHLTVVALIALLAPFAVWIRLSEPVEFKLTTTESHTTNRALSWSRHKWLILLIILGVAAGLRALNIDYKEFQGDEGVIMVRAAQAIAGDEMALLRHQKGPIEILLPLIPWGLTGSINETWARAVFTWAGWLAVGAIGLLGRRLYDGPTGLLAAFFFAIGGFGIAFSRIVQYQSFVMLWTLLSVIFAYRYYRRGAYADLLLSAAFLAAGLLAHYDAILSAPALAWLIIARWQKNPVRWQRHLLSATLFGALLLALFYVPYLAGPSAGGTGSYLLQDRIGGNLFSWSGPQVWRMATFYNSTYYILLLILLAAAGIVSRKRNAEHIASLLLLIVPLVFYTVVVADPRTHVYTVFPGLCLVAAAGAVSVWQRVKLNRPRHRLARYVGLPLFALMLIASLIYVVLMFVDVTPERQRTWNENRPPFFPITWADPPQYGLFGFPHQAGWRVAPELVNDLPYGSNEESEITGWYMAQAPRTHCAEFQTFLVAANAQDALPYDEARVYDLPLTATITVNGQPSLQIYSDAAPVAQPATIEATGRELWRTPRQVAPPVRTGEISANVVFGDQIRLLGYTIQQATVEAGGFLDVILYWQALEPIPRNYQVFVHLFDGKMWAQHDGAPDCDVQPTSGWEPGQVVRDAHRLQLSADVPQTEIPLLVGMYDLITLERLQVDDGGRDTVHLTNIIVSRTTP